jgi:hypothetical protein
MLRVDAIFQTFKNYKGFMVVAYLKSSLYSHPNTVRKVNPSSNNTVLASYGTQDYRVSRIFYRLPVQRPNTVLKRPYSTIGHSYKPRCDDFLVHNASHDAVVLLDSHCLLQISSLTSCLKHESKPFTI